MQHARAILVILVICVAGAASAAESRDGTWWLQQREGIRLFYIIGVLDGLQAAIEPLAPNNAPGELADRFNDTLNNAVGNIRAGQIKDGLDAFYHDPRNRHIPAPRAFWIVIASSSGLPEDQLTRLIEKARAASH